jgi:hypothetical protein
MPQERAPASKAAVAERRPASATKSAAQAAPAKALPLARKLQARLGNRATQAVAAQVVSNSLSLSRSSDSREREADSVADTVMRMAQPTPKIAQTEPSAPSAPIVQRRCADCEEERGPQVTNTVAASIRSLQGNGRPLPAATRAFFEPRFDADFGNVRVHTDTQAARTASSINARAFTLGSDIAFAAGQFSPNTDTGQRLLAHELTHVVQQQGGQAASTIFRTEDKGGADTIINKHRGGLGGGLDTHALGQLLFKLAWMSTDHYPLVVQTLDRLEWEGEDDDVAEVFTASARDDNLQTFASTDTGRKMLRAMEDAMVGGFTTVGERAQIFRLRQAVAQQIAADKGQEAGLKILDKEPTAAAVATPKKDAPLLTLGQLDERFRLIDAVLARMAKRYEKDPLATVSIVAARLRLGIVRAGVGVDNAAELSRTVPDAQTILERTEAVLLNLDLQLATYGAADDPSAKAYIVLTQRVRGGYLAPIALLLQDGAVAAFERAERVAAQLPRALSEVDLAQLEGRAPTTQLLEGNRIDIATWAGRVRTQMNAIEADAQAIADARKRNAPDLAARLERFERQRELLDLSLRGLAHYDRALKAHEYLVSEGAVHWAGYQDTSALRARCMAMKAAAEADDLKSLREKVTAYENDPAILEFYQKKIPQYLIASRMLVGLGITLAAAMVTAGVGSAFTSTIGTAATTTGRAFALAGTAAVEAITFTAVSRGLSTIGTTSGPHGSAFSDLAWNFGLFLLLRIAGGAVRTRLQAQGLELLEKPVHLVTSATLLQAYGAVRFRQEEGRWPTGDELAMMTGENLMMLIGITLVTRSIPKLFEARTQFKNLRTFAHKYSWRFERLEAGRQSLLNQFRSVLEGGKAADAAELARLKAAGKTVEDALKSLLAEIKADRSFSLEGAAKELAALNLGKIEGSEELLAKSLGLPEEVRLRWGGALDQYTYEWSGTTRLENALRALGATVEKTAEPGTGLRTLTANFKERPAMTFVEREAPLAPAAREVEIPLNAPELLQLIADFGINDPAAQRYLVRLLGAELVKNPSHGLSSAAKPVAKWLRQLAAKAKKAGTTTEQELLEVRKRGFHGAQASPALIALVDALMGRGVLTTPEWLAARTLAEFGGVVSEMLGYEQAAARAAPGETVLRRVRIIGDLYEDAALTRPRVDKASGRARVSVDVVPELDLLVVKDQGGGGLEIQRLSNIKKSAGGGAGAAQKQNQMALEALRAHAKGAPFALVTTDGVALYGRVTQVRGYTGVGAEVVLTGRLAEAPAGATTETIGPKGARAYDVQLPVQEGEIGEIVRILRERQAQTSPNY